MPVRPRRRPLRVQSGDVEPRQSIATFVAPLLHPLLSIGIVIILALFILLDRDHLSDKFVRLFGASDVHATSRPWATPPRASHACCRSSS